jgi:hypothetical protein
MLRLRTEQLDHDALTVAYHCVTALASAAATQIDNTEIVKSYWRRGLTLLGDLCSTFNVGDLETSPILHRNRR